VPGRTGSVAGEVCQPGTVPCVPVPGPTLDDPDAPRATDTPAAPTVSPPPTPRPRPTELAETGVNVGGLFTLGAALLLSGLVLLNRFRRIR
jgi:LPXTG-motif cell wall-anchored protein